MYPKKINKKFGGKYIATESFTSNKVIASGKDPAKVYKDATKKGVQEPVINYIHKEGVICIY
ncbi:MAG: hypothetical protein JXB24_03120 [Bacteroidales bacterium]|nr:hypothetical protein [Bacteroidales bacterium]